MRIVLDTNIVVSGFLWGGPPRQILSQATLLPRTSLALYSSPWLIAELELTLSKPKLAQHLLRNQTSVGNLIQRYHAIVQLVTPTHIPRIVASDPDDDHVIATALQARADYIVSGDSKHLLPLKTYQGIPIVSARAALDTIQSP